MKRSLLLIITALSLLILSNTGCIGIRGLSNQQQFEKVYPYVQPAATTICFVVLNTAVDDADRVNYALKISTTADIVYNLSSGQAPTSQQLHDAITVFDPTSLEYVKIADNLKVLYELYYADVMTSDPDTNALYAAKILKALAAGCFEAANRVLEGE